MSDEKELVIAIVRRLLDRDGCRLTIERGDLEFPDEEHPGLMRIEWDGSERLAIEVPPNRTVEGYLAGEYHP